MLEISLLSAEQKSLLEGHTLARPSDLLRIPENLMLARTTKLSLRPSFSSLAVHQLQPEVTNVRAQSGGGKEGSFV